jgi:hypothetical protein
MIHTQTRVINMFKINRKNHSVSGSTIKSNIEFAKYSFEEHYDEEEEEQDLELTNEDEIKLQTINIATQSTTTDEEYPMSEGDEGEGEEGDEGSSSYNKETQARQEQVIKEIKEYSQGVKERLQARIHNINITERNKMVCKWVGILCLGLLAAFLFFGSFYLIVLIRRSSPYYDQSSPVVISSSSSSSSTGSVPILSL